MKLLTARAKASTVAVMTSLRLALARVSPMGKLRQAKHALPFFLRRLKKLWSLRIALHRFGDQQPFSTGCYVRYTYNLGRIVLRFIDRAQT